jgi:hypothetical protein
MKNLVIICLFLFSTVYSQDQITKKLGDFHTLKVFNGLKVELVHAATPKIEILGSRPDVISVKNSNGILKIRVDILEGFRNENVNVIVYYKNVIHILDANEGALITSEKAIKQNQLEIKVQEGARAILPINTKFVAIKAVSGGVVELRGKSENQQVEASTGAMYHGFELESKEAQVVSATGARVEVNAADMLDAKVRLKGLIYYKGNPETLYTKKTVGGTIQKVD